MSQIKAAYAPNTFAMLTHIIQKNKFCWLNNSMPSHTKFILRYVHFLNETLPSTPFQHSDDTTRPQQASMGYNQQLCISHKVCRGLTTF